MLARNKIDSDDLKKLAIELGADLAGIASSQSLGDDGSELLKISRFSSAIKSVVVLGKKMFMGTLRAKDLGTKQQNGGLILMRLEEIACRLADRLEQMGHSAIVVPTAHIDFDIEGPEKYCPAGQGSLFLRQASVKAGLGTLGINTMLLTKEFGPRLFLGGLLTDLQCEPAPAISQELCPGLEQCGNCAAVCPEDAIPRRAPVSATISSYRGLNARACLRSSQPFGLNTFLDHLAGVLKAKGGPEVEAVIRSRTTCELWQNMTTLNHGTFAGCMECWHVCPLGEDFSRLSESETRKNDLPGGPERHISNGIVTVGNVGPQMRRPRSW